MATKILNKQRITSLKPKTAVFEVMDGAERGLGVRGKLLAQAAAMAKAFSTDVAMKVATDAMQLFGASSISNYYPINRYFPNAKVGQIVEGSNQIQRNIIAKYLIDPIEEL